MAVPKKRHTKSRRNRRRSHLALKKKNLSSCPKCGEPILSHHACNNCGTYKGRMVIDVLAKLEKKEKKLKAKELESQEKEQKQDKPLDLKELSKKQ
ncbi:50S ribosomal protein L32 [Patescibacteria group bacterium]|nr:50S ribosomal protein L32 [Patescibacteria group bacterium]MBU3922678.1 50S ribosomal protein L32 [Patescibacteria group bacterium]